jgi:hypothetical protein
MTNNLLADTASNCMSSCLSGGRGTTECAQTCFPLNEGTNEITNPALGSLTNQTGISFIQKLITSLVTLGLIVGALIFFFTLLMGAIQWITSGGDKQALENARGKISNALIGLVILLAVFAIVKLIERFFGISILTLDIGKLIIQ